jgi:ketosteroid isomerase-like protein
MCSCKSIYFPGEGKMEKVLFNKDVALTIFSSLNNRDLSDLSQHLAQDAIFDFPGAGCIEGHKHILTFFKVLFRKYSRLTFTVEHVISEGKRVCAIWSNEGEDKSGNPYNNRGITFVEVSDGKIVSISDYFKDTSFTKST